MWRVHNITTLCRQCLPIHQRNRWLKVLFYSTSSKRRPSANQSGAYEISGIYSGTHSSTPRAPFLKALDDVQQVRRGGEKRGGRRGEAEQTGWGGARRSKDNEGKEHNEDRRDRPGGQRREWQHKQGKRMKDGNDQEKQDGSAKPIRNRMKKRKPEPFVIYKAPARVEVDRGQFENTMFVKKMKPSSKRGEVDSATQPDNEASEDVQIEEERRTVVEERRTKEDVRRVEPVGKAEKQPAYRNSMFKRPDLEALEEEEVVDEGEEEVTEEAKQRIRRIGEGRVEKREGDTFVQKIIQESEDGMRMDRWASIHYPAMPHSKLCKILRSKLISYSAPPETQRKKATTDTRLAQGNIVHVYSKLGMDTKVEKAPLLRLTDNELEVIKSWVIHRDDHVLIINKPEGLPVQGGTKVGRHLAQLLHALRGEKEEDPRLVHRLDRDTSGVLVLARTRQAATKLTDMFKNNKVTKIYWALIAGIPKSPIGRINMPLEKITGPRGDERIVPREKVTKTAKAASTDYNVVEELSSCSFVVLAPNTGRTHQLRVHCAAALGAHIVGDQKYGDGREVSSLQEILERPPDRLHLHARRIVFIHPFTNKKVNVAAKLPEHMLQTWSSLGLNPNFKEKLSEIAENPNKEPELMRKPEKTYGKEGNVRRSIWKPKISSTPIRDMKMRSAQAKHTKKVQRKKMMKKGEKKGEKKEEKEKGGSGKRRTRVALVKEQQYRAMRRARPVRRLAPKIKK